MELKDVPKRARRIIECCQQGEVLCRYIRRGAEDEINRFAYELHPSMKVVGPKTAQVVLATGLLVPQGDGLFGDDTSQTYRAA